MLHLPKLIVPGGLRALPSIYPQVEYFKERWGKERGLTDPNSRVEPVTNSSPYDDCIVGIFVQLLKGFGQLLTHVSHHGGLQCIMPHTNKRILEVYEDVIHA